MTEALNASTELTEVVPVSAAEMTVIANASDVLAQRAGDLVIVEHAGLEAASKLLEDANGARDDVLEQANPPVSNAHKLHKQLVAMRNEAVAPIDDVIKLVKEKVGVYQSKERERLRLIAAETERKARVEDEKRRKEEAIRRAEEEKRREEAAEALAEAGDTDGAVAILDEPLPPAPDPEPLSPPPAQTAPPKVKGISASVVHKAKIDNMKAVIVAAAGGDGNALAVLTTEKGIAAATSAANGLARTMKMNLKIPGVRVYTEERIASR